MLLHHSRAFTDAAPYVFPMVAPPLDGEWTETGFTITVTPGAGCTLRVDFSFNYGRTYNTWAPGEVTAETSAFVQAGQTPTHIKVTQTIASTESFLTLTK